MPAIMPIRREPSGRPQRDNAAKVKQAMEDRENAERAFVAGQPHRKGDGSQMAETECGRFIIRYGLDPACYAAAMKYWSLSWSYRRSIGAHVPMRINHGGLMVHDAKDREQEWKDTIDGVVDAIQRECGPGVVLPVNSLVLDDRLYPEPYHRLIARGLWAMAKQLGTANPKGAFEARGL